MPATPKHSTNVVNSAWNDATQEGRIKTPVTKRVGYGMYAWYNANAPDPDGDGVPDSKAGWAFPHHMVDSSGTPGDANIRAVRTALSNVDASRIPATDKAAVKAHLQAHVDDNKNASTLNEGPVSELTDNSIASLAWLEASGRTWGMIPEAFMELRELRSYVPGLRAMESHLLSVIAAEGAEAQVEAAVRRGRPPAINGDVAVIDLQGVIQPKASLLAMLFGLGGGLDMFRAQLADAVNSDKVGAIVLNIDSPGGLVDGVPETAAMIRDAAGVKPITAVANTMAASAAYWLGSQASDFAVAPSGEAGSIGVYAEHRDLSKALEGMGMKPTLVSAGKFKTEGNPYEPLTEEARAALQQSVDDYYGMFVKDVAAGRGDSVGSVRAGYGEGRVLTAKRAVEAGLADKVATLDEVIAGYQRRARPPGQSALASSDAARVAAILSGVPYHKESAQ